MNRTCVSGAALYCAILCLATSCATATRQATLGELREATLAADGGDFRKANAFSRKALESNPRWESALVAVRVTGDVLDGKLAGNAGASLMDTVWFATVTGKDEKTNRVIVSNAYTCAMNVVRTAPDYAFGHFMLAVVYARQQQLERAVAAAARAVELEPNLILTQQAMAGLCYRVKDYPRAIVHCDKALALGATFPDGFLKELAKYRPGSPKEGEICR